MSIAFLFPGLGSQRPGMLHRLPDTAASATVLAEADAALRSLTPPTGVAAAEDWAYPSGIVEIDTAESLENSPAAVHVALLIAGVAGAQAMVEDEEVAPLLVAGHGAGGFAAAVVAGVLTLEEALRAVQLRGELLGSGGQSERTVAVRLAQHLATVPRRPQDLPYVSGAYGRCLRGDANAVFDDLAQGAAMPVRWPEALAACVGEGAECGVEMPPGRVLTGSAADGTPGLRVTSVEEHGIAEAADFALGEAGRLRRDAAAAREIDEDLGWGQSNFA